MRVAAKTWGGDFYTKGGGGAVWDGFAYDPDANLVYVGTGNAEPWTQKFRGAKNLDNLYTCSILAVDLTTGILKWHFQTVPNDNWDFDSVQQLMLLDLQIDGRVRKVLTQAAKNGFFYAIDRVSGQFISAFPFVKVNWAKGIDDSGRPMVNPEAYYDTEPVQCTRPVAVPITGRRCHSIPILGWSTFPLPTRRTPTGRPTNTEGSNGDVRATTEPRQIKAAAIGPSAPGRGSWRPAGLGSGETHVVWRGDGGGASAVAR
jgi:quinohemoprotein ethanol dehydrogenase